MLSSVLAAGSESGVPVAMTEIEVLGTIVSLTGWPSSPTSLTYSPTGTGEGSVMVVATRAA